MSEDRPTTRQGFISRIFQNAGEDGTTIYSREEVGVGEPGGYEGVGGRGGFTVERAADIIENLPPEVPQPAAVVIVRRTLEAAGIDIADLATSTKARESKLNSEMDLSHDRIQQIQDSTDEVIRSLEEEIRRAREARDVGVAEEEQKIADAQMGLEDVRMVRDFFGMPSDLPRDDAEVAEDPADTPRDYVPTGDDTQVIQPVNEDDTQILRRPGPLSGGWDSSEEDTWESPNR